MPADTPDTSSLVEEIERMRAENAEQAAWHANKAALHANLDGAGVPVFDGEECRIAARVRWLLTRLVEKEYAIRGLTAQAENVREEKDARIAELERENAELRASQAASVAAEREACRQIADMHICEQFTEAAYLLGWRDCRQSIERAIRSRGESKGENDASR